MVGEVAKFQPQHDSIAEAMGAVLASNTELRAMAEKLVYEALRQCSRALGPFGSPSDKSALMKMVMGHAIKSMSQANTQGEMAAEQAAYLDLRASLAAAIAPVMEDRANTTLIVAP